MTDRGKAIFDRLQAALQSYSPASLERLARRLMLCANAGLSETETDILRHRAFGREKEAATCERLLIEYERDMKLGLALLDLALLNR